jgi:UDP-GlcNAc3NAcA epimerase
MKIFTIVGARPQFVKASVFSKLLKEKKTGIEEVIVHTGQHYDQNMSDIFFSSLGIPEPAYNLGVGGGTHGYNTGMMLIEIEKLLLSGKPDAVLVYGDTDSTLAGSLAASKLHIPVIHIEAGLRSFNKRMPEEQNRIITDHMAALLFAPTETAVRNLRNEGVPEKSVFLVGDIMYDATLHFGELAKQTEEEFLQSQQLDKQAYHLLTIHREENTSDPAMLQEIFSAFEGKNIPVILPLHPRTRKKIADFSIQMPQNIRMIDPVGYMEMLSLLKNAKYVFTDSGGVQKEAYFLGRPCFTLRNETEWVELLDIGANMLTKPAQIADYINGHSTRQEIINNGNLYGGGKAAENILSVIKQYFSA